MASNRTKTGYALKNVLVQAPETVKWAILSVLGVGLALFHVDPSLLETVGVGMALERLLNLFYVKPAKQIQEEQQLQQLHNHTLESISLGKQLASARPLKGDTHTHKG